MTSILVIDDEPQLRSVLVRILSRAGHAVIEAKDGREGMKLFYAHRPQLVITDVFMPDKEGIETIGEIRRKAPETYIIAISGGARSFAPLDLAAKLGADATLAKPFRLDELLALVARFCPAPLAG